MPSHAKQPHILRSMRRIPLRPIHPDALMGSAADRYLLLWSLWRSNRAVLMHVQHMPMSIKRPLNRMLRTCPTLTQNTFLLPAGLTLGELGLCRMILDGWRKNTSRDDASTVA